MTVANEMNQCLNSLRSIQSSLSALVLLSEREESRETLYETMLAVKETAMQVKKRTGELECAEKDMK